MTVDNEKFTWLYYYLISIFIMPIQIIVSIIMIFIYIGVSFSSGLGVIILSFFVNFLIGKLNWKTQKQVMDAKDDRTKATNEFFS